MDNSIHTYVIVKLWEDEQLERYRYDLGKKMDSNSEKVYKMGQKCLFKYETQQEALVCFYWHRTTTFMW